MTTPPLSTPRPRSSTRPSACGPPSPTAASRSPTARRWSSSPTSTAPATGTPSPPGHPTGRLRRSVRSSRCCASSTWRRRASSTPSSSGFAIDWERTFDDHAPVYLQASRDGAVLHLSEHHGDASPGATVRILVADVMGLHRELHERDYPYARPGVETEPWGLEVSGARPVRQPDRLPPAHLGGRRTEGGGTAAGPIEHEYVVKCPPGHAFRGVHRGRSSSGGTRRTHRPVSPR